MAVGVRQGQGARGPHTNSYTARRATGCVPAAGRGRSPDVGRDSPRARQGLGVRGVDLQVVCHTVVDHLRCDTAIPGPRLPVRSSRPAATALSHLTAIHGTSSPARACCHRCWDTAPPRKASSTMTRPPARAIVAAPSIHAFSSPRNRGPTLTPPSAANAMPASEACMAGGIALDQHVDPHGKPRIGLDRLQAPGYPRLARDGSAFRGRPRRSSQGIPRPRRGKRSAKSGHQASVRRATVSVNN